MRKIHLLTSLLVLLLSLFCLNSCQHEELIKDSIYYSKLRLGRMDIDGAVSLALNPISTRAAGGEALPSGLYKIDSNGNITAVHVYITEDTLGNKIEHQEVLRVVPQKIFKITENFMLAAECWYYEEGNTLGNWFGLSSHYLLVRLSDGKIWSVDKIEDNLLNNYIDYSLRGSFLQDEKGNLYHCNINVYKFNLDGNIPSYEQVTSGIDIGSETFHIADNGVFWSVSTDYKAYHGDIDFAWPYSGFQSISLGYGFDDAEMVYDETEKIIPYNYENDYREYDLFRLRRGLKSIFTTDVNNRPGIMVISSFDCKGHRIDYDWYSFDHDFVNEHLNGYPWEVARYLDVSIGDTPGSSKIIKENPILLTNPPESVGRDYNDNSITIETLYVGDNYILTSDGGEKSWITLLDLEKREWKWLKQLDFEVDFNDGLYYDGKIWLIDTDANHFGARWFNPKSLADGFISFNNVTIPDFINRKWYQFENGKITYSGSNPADGKVTKIIIDIATGEIDQSVDNPEMLFETLIRLN